LLFEPLSHAQSERAKLMVVGMDGTTTKGGGKTRKKLR